MTQAGAEGEDDAPEAGLVHMPSAPEADGPPAPPELAAVVVEAVGPTVEFPEEGSTQQSVDLSASQASGGNLLLVDGACSCKIRAGVRCEARAAVHVPVLDVVRFEKRTEAGIEPAQGIDAGVDQLGTWWCDAHAGLAIDFAYKGPCAARQAEAWERAIAEAVVEIGTRAEGRMAYQRIQQLEAECHVEYVDRVSAEYAQEQAASACVRMQHEIDELQKERPRLLYKTTKLASTLTELRTLEAALGVSQDRYTQLHQEYIVSTMRPPPAPEVVGVPHDEHEQMKEANARQISGLQRETDALRAEVGRAQQEEATSVAGLRGSLSRANEGWQLTLGEVKASYTVANELREKLHESERGSSIQAIDRDHRLSAFEGRLRMETATAQLCAGELHQRTAVIEDAAYQSVVQEFRAARADFERA